MATPLDECMTTNLKKNNGVPKWNTEFQIANTAVHTLNDMHCYELRYALKEGLWRNQRDAAISMRYCTSGVYSFSNNQ